MEVSEGWVTTGTGVLSALLGGLLTLFAIGRTSGAKEAQAEARLKAVEARLQMLEEDLERSQDRVCEEIKSLRRLFTTPEGAQKFMTWSAHEVMCGKANDFISKDINNLGKAIRDLSHKIDILEGKVDRFYVPKSGG